MDDKNVQIIAKIVSYAEKILDYCKDISEAAFAADSKLVEDYP